MNMLNRLMGKRNAGAGRGFVNPKTVAEMGEEEGSPAEREARQMIKDRKAAKGASEAYDKAMPSPYKSGGKVSSASKRADGCAIKGKTKGTMVKMAGGGKC
jgi:hypothetical protein